MEKESAAKLEIKYKHAERRYLIQFVHEMFVLWYV